MTETDEFERARLVERIVRLVRPLLGGHPPEIQSAVLADLLATWVAGHQGEPEEFREVDSEPAAELAAFREQILQDHIELVRAMIPFNEQEIKNIMAAPGSAQP